MSRNLGISVVVLALTNVAHGGFTTFRAEPTIPASHEIQRFGNESKSIVTLVRESPPHMEYTPKADFGHLSQTKLTNSFSFSAPRLTVALLSKNSACEQLDRWCFRRPCHDRCVTYCGDGLKCKPDCRAFDCRCLCKGDPHGSVVPEPGSLMLWASILGILIPCQRGLSSHGWRSQLRLLCRFRTQQAA
jgi:hypothetical protein